MLKKKNPIVVNNQNRQSSLVSATYPNSPSSEQYRTLRTTIEFLMVDRGLKTLGVTSSQTGEGKTTSISNLAIVFAKQGKKVLLMDTDLRKPTHAKIFGLQNQMGVTNLILEKKQSISAACQETAIQNLSVMVSGAIPPNPSEMLDSDRMSTIISQAKEQFELVLFDLPPVLPVTDAQIMSAKLDGIIVVVRQRKTLKKDLLKTKENLENVKADVLGVIFNGVERSHEDYYYYYEEE